MALRFMSVPMQALCASVLHSTMLRNTPRTTTLATSCQNIQGNGRDDASEVGNVVGVARQAPRLIWHVRCPTRQALAPPVAHSLGFPSRCNLMNQPSRMVRACSAALHHQHGSPPEPHAFLLVGPTSNNIGGEFPSEGLFCCSSAHGGTYCFAML